jgi:hypothetical protein
MHYSGATNCGLCDCKTYKWIWKEFWRIYVFKKCNHEWKVGATMIEKKTGKTVEVMCCTKCPEQYIRRGNTIDMDDM